jgi:hypothetical protein
MRITGTARRGFWTAVAAIALAAAGCAKRDSAYLSASVDPAGGGEGGMAMPPAPALPRSVGITPFDKVLTAMASATGVVPSAPTAAFVTQNQTSFSLNGEVGEITSGMWMSVTTLAGHVCRDLYDQELARPAAERRYYGGVALGAGGPFTARDEVIRRLALGAWGRLPMAAEQAEFQNALSAGGLAGGTLSATQTRDALLVLCTGTLASLAAQVR